jgi:predicted membrane-bound mannosyltransferase/DNA-binding beta-propeller fold protein YncE
MTVESSPMSSIPSRVRLTLDRQLGRLITIDAERLAYLVIFILAVLTRFWDLGVRVMSHDESLHTRYSWNLYHGDGFSHTPLMHGPLLFHVTALNYLLFGDSDFSARIYPAVVGIIVVMLPIFMRRWLGKLGAISASFLFLISPLILYYSRYIRHDMPAIFGALVIAISAWRYMEERRFRYLVTLAIGQFVLFASKEVSFIYIAIFGSYFTLYFVSRLIDVEWPSRRWRAAFAGVLVAVLVGVGTFGGILYLEHRADKAASELPGGAAQTVTPVDPETGEPVAEGFKPLELSLPASIALGFFGAAMVALILVVLIGQWRNLRRFPELDMAVTIGSLILPMLSPFLIKFAGFNPMDSTEAGVFRGLTFTIPMVLVSGLIGLAYFMVPPQPRRLGLTGPLTEDEMASLEGVYDPDTQTIEVQPDAIDWVLALFTSRWWALGGPFWLLFLFFFTTMFTNGNGIATGIVGSLGYWLAQQEVERGNQPWYYYIMVMVPMYEFLPALLSMVAGAIGLGSWIRRLGRPRVAAAPSSSDDQVEGTDQPAPARPAALIDLDAPISFPMLTFAGYWAVLNFFAYSLAGEKMPWLTSHLTTPMILLAGWVIGRMISRVNWRSLWDNRGWALFALLPLFTVALMRIMGPGCRRWEANPLCNTIIPESYQTGALAGRTVADLAATGVWIAALVVLIASLIGSIRLAYRRIRTADVARLVGLMVVGWLMFLTARSAWTASFINYDYANEFLVYAHSNRAVKDVLEQVEEISYKTTDGLGLRVAYDNRMSWPMLWYLRNYPNAIYFSDQPSRGLIGDAPVIMAGAANWSKVEALLGDRYYQFEYIRMVWPMQDYFGYEEPDRLIQVFRDVLADPQLQRGLWDIFYRRDYETYADAVMKYRGGVRPNFSLSAWPVPDRMRLYIRKDIFAQVWDYGVAASEIAEAVDPYSANVRPLTPDFSFGQGFLNRPHGLDIGPDGLLYVADSGNHQVVVFDQEGNYIRTLGTFGLAPLVDALNEPWDVAVAPGGDVFVADTWNHRIVSYDAQGAYRLSWGYEGLVAGGEMAGFWGPRGIVTDADGNVYVADTGNKRIMVFDENGTLIRQIGSGGGLDGQVDEPVGLAFSPDGLLYVADTWNQRIQVFTREGLFVRAWFVEAWFGQSNERPYLDVDSSGNVYVTDPDASRVIVFNSRGDFLFSFGDFATIQTAGAVEIDSENGYLYAIDTAVGQVQRYVLPVPGVPVP